MKELPFFFLYFFAYLNKGKEKPDTPFNTHPQTETNLVFTPCIYQFSV
jgi:hypothetical protein